MPDLIVYDEVTPFTREDHERILERMRRKDSNSTPVPFHRTKTDDGNFIRDAIVIESDVVSFDLVFKGKDGRLLSTVCRINVAPGPGNDPFRKVNIDVIPKRGGNSIKVSSWNEGVRILHESLPKGSLVALVVGDEK